MENETIQDRLNELTQESIRVEMGSQPTYQSLSPDWFSPGEWDEVGD